MASGNIVRCAWAHNDRLAAYHDNEWGVPLHDDRKHFEFIVLDGAQAGLSWDIVLSKREGYRRAFDNFDPTVVVGYDQAKIEALLQDEGIVRNRRKVVSAVRNALAFLDVQEAFGNFDAYIWQFVGGQPIANAWESLQQVPATSPESDAMSKDLKKRGFSFVGSTICYAYMQAAGMVNDHVVGCFRHREVLALR